MDRINTAAYDWLLHKRRSIEPIKFPPISASSVITSSADSRDPDMYTSKRLPQVQEKQHGPRFFSLSHQTPLLYTLINNHLDHHTRALWRKRGQTPSPPFFARAPGHGTLIESALSDSTRTARAR